MSKPKIFEPSSLKRLMEATNRSTSEVAEATGISQQRLHEYLEEQAIPTLADITALKKYFGMPYEVIVGTTDQWRSLPTETDPKELGWPYNLLARLNSEWTKAVVPIDYLVTPEHVDYIVAVMEIIPERERRILLAHFKDGKGLKELAEAEGVTYERIRQLVERGIKYLRRTTIRTKLLYGPKLTIVLDSLEQREAELAERARKLDLQERELSTRTTMLEKRRKILEKQEIDLSKRHAAAVAKSLDVSATRTTNAPSAGTETTWLPVYNTELHDLDLSARALNCLGRADCLTLGDVVVLAREGKIMRPRNLGERTAKEILTLIYRLTGEDLFEQNFLKSDGVI